jgi:hypothetical protein
MKEIVTVRVVKHDEYPVSESLLSLARDIGSHLDFELAGDHPRWSEIVAYCARLAEWKRHKREIEASLGVPIPAPVLDAVAHVIREGEREARERGWVKPPDRGWTWVDVRRRYTEVELRAAPLLHLIPWPAAAIPWESQWVVLDRERACRMCLAAPQQAPLVFRSSSLARTREIQQDGRANALLASDRLVRVLAEHGLTGWSSRAIFRARGSALREIPGWKQLVVTAEVGPAVPPTVFGRSPFHPDPHNLEGCRVCGLTRPGLQSELYLPASSWEGSDLALTRDRIGGEFGLGHPVQLLVVSQRLYGLLREHRVQGFRVERVHLV